jgi:adenine phosphoribosyltransferase
MEEMQAEMKKFLLMSTSGIKRDAMREIFPKAKIIQLPVPSNSDAAAYNAEQPVGDAGLISAKLRVQSGLPLARDFDYVVAIENSIRREGGTRVVDVCSVVIYDMAKKTYLAHTGSPVAFDVSYWDRASKYPHESGSGFSKTVGELMVADGVATNAKDWFSAVGGGMGRVEQIKQVMWSTLFSRASIDAVLANVDYRWNHPKRGVLFQDLQPVLAQPELYNAIIEHVAHVFGDRKVDVVVGLDARGFIWGSMVATHLKCGFVMARKAGKLPEPKVTESYATEYSWASLEMAADVFREPNMNVLLVDDLIATGGTLIATVKLLRRTHNPPNVIGCYCPLRVKSLFDESCARLAAEANVPEECIVTLMQH